LTRKGSRGVTEAVASIAEPRFGPPEALPFPAGMGPFRQKGNGYLGDFAHLDLCVPGGTKAVLSAITDPATRAFFSQRLRAAEWYDAFPGATLHAVAARLRNVPYAEHRRQVGVYHAGAAGSVYRTLLRVVSNENVAIWGPRVSSLYFEFGRFETRVAGPKLVVGTRKGVPAGLVQSVLHGSKGFTEETLRLAGAKAASFEIGDVRQEGRSHGQDLYDVSIRVAWV
jgi:hypothetical protein